MGSAITNFLSVVEARSLGTADIDKMAAAIDKQTASLDGLSKHADKVNNHPGFGDFANKVKQGIQDPLGTVETLALTAANALGPFGIAVTAAGATLAALAITGFEAAKSLAAYGQQIENTGLRTGLTAKEVVQFGFAAKLVDQDVTVFERSMRGLTEAMTDTSSKGDKARQALQQLGVVPRTLNGDLKPTGEILLELSTALNKLPDAFTRNQVGMDIFKRAWIEIGPSILKLTEGVKLANEQGFFGPSRAELDKWDEFDKRVTTAEAKWDRFIRNLKQYAAENFLPDEDYWKRLRSLTPEGQVNAVRDLPTTRVSPSFLGGLDAYAAQDRASGNALLNAARGGMSRTLDGLRLSAEAAKQKYDDAYRSLQTLSDVGTAAAQKQIDSVASLKKTYDGLNEQLKLAEKTEAARLAILEQAEALRRKGQGFYQFGDGPNAFFITEQQITDANTRAPGSLQAPSLFGFGRSSSLSDSVYERELDENGKQTGRLFLHSEGVRAARQSYAGSPVVPISGLTAGLQPNGDFVSPDSARGGDTSYQVEEFLTAPGADQIVRGYMLPNLQTGITATSSTAQSSARTAAESQKRLTNEQATLGIMNAEADAVARLVELRAGPGGELAAARIVAGIREQALQRELEQTGDIAKNREESRRNELDLTLKIAEAEKQRIDNIRSFGSGLLDAALGGGKGLQQFGTNILLNQGRTIAGNAAQQLFGHFSPYLGSTSKLFQGTVLGQDPLKGSTDANTAATIDNTIKLMALTARLSMSSTSGGGGSYSSAASTFAKLMGGSSSGGSGGGSYINENGDDLSLAAGDFDSLNPGMGAPMGGVGYTPLSSTFNPLQALGIGAAAVGGGLGIYSGINTGGARGALTAAGSGVAAAGAIAALASKALSWAGPVGMIAGMGLGLLTSFLGDPKQNRRNEIDREAQSRTFNMPSGADYSVDASGHYVDYNAAGQVRRVDVTNHIYAMDSKSLTDFLLDNPGALSQGLAGAISGGNAEDTMSLIQQRVAP